ncbi:MAG TPA: CehA/McbA family metallohydrolase [Vicinamibacterales bacterium]|nr:CehA/McbA family metallohydrolase [Vicinamibacterales bacterium]
MHRLVFVLLGLIACGWPLSAQWTNRYQRIGQGHHVYVEGYDFPTYSVGPTYPAVSPDGRTIAFSARGWLWTMSAAGGPAERITKGAGMDSRPAWHPDGTRIVFVRDDTRNTDIVEVDVKSGAERVLVATPAAELDPAYSLDGQTLYYASAETGDLEIWRLDVASQQKTQITDARGLDLRPQPIAGGAVVFVSKRGTGDEVAVIDSDGTRRVLAMASIASLARPAVSADGRRVAVPLPVLSSTDWALQLLDVAGGPMTEIVSGGGHPIMPAWSPDGRHVYFSRADERGAFGLWCIDAGGGVAQPIVPTAWDWKAPTATLALRISAWRPAKAASEAVTARVRVTDAHGHPIFATGRQAWLDGQNGSVFTYTPLGGELQFEMPAGEYHIEAARGFKHLPARGTRTYVPGQVSFLDMSLQPVSGPSFEGWYSGDHHFHLNYGGQVLLAPDALVSMMHGEDLDVATPLSANLHTRRIDEEYFAWERREPPLIQFGQEVRSHFLGHTGHIGVKTLYWPWYWGPGYPVYGLDDRSNSGALQQTRAQGGVNSYVHPVTVRAPFGGDAPRGIPLELVSDAVLGDVDTIELACLWSDELGTADAWYRLLSVGVPIAPSAGTDAMVDFFRTMAIGTTRVYVKVPGPLTMEGYLAGLKAGRSFVTNGPLLRFTVGGAEPGDVVKPTDAPTAWELQVASSLPFERVEVLINGQVVWSGDGLTQPGTQTYRGTVTAPAGGWMAARVHGGVTAWPAMDSYPFAHTAPLWFGSIGSTDAAAASAAARELLAALDVAEQRVRQSYGETPTPTLLGRINDARLKLAIHAR